jgi:hypothetical protein
LKTRLTACRVTRRLALEPSRRLSRAASTDCSVQKRKMHRPMASTVLVVRTQFRRRCLRM